MSDVIAVPDIVRNKAALVGADHWLDQLPALVSTLEREWRLTVGACFEDATEAFVAEATLVDGSVASRCGGQQPDRACRQGPRRDGGWSSSSPERGRSWTDPARSGP